MKLTLGKGLDQGSAWLMGRLRSRRLALSIQGTSLRILLAERNRITSWAETPFNPTLLRGGLIADQEGMARVMKNALDSKRMPAAPVVAAFPGFQSVVRILRLPHARGVRPDEVLIREARRLMAYSDAGQYLFWQPAGIAGKFQDFLTVAVPKGAVHAFVETLKLAGLAPDRMELAPLCLAKVIPQGQAVLADVESNSIDIVVVVDSVPALVRSLWLGDEPLTSDSAPARLAEELVSTINFYNSGNPDTNLAATLPIHVAGGFLTEDLAPVVARETGHPVAPLMTSLVAPDGFPSTAMAVNAGLIAGK